jgi:hypothetical protein
MVTSADFTALKAKTSVVASIASARRSSGTSSVRTPRASAARNGNSSDVKSSAGATTCVPGGSAAVTVESIAETWLPTATHAAGTPTSPA